MSSPRAACNESVAGLLAEHYHSSDLSYILIDANTHRPIASRWDQKAEPVSVGWLVKPFIALAYGQKHNFRYPTYFCHGTTDGCWLPRGHGKVDISAGMESALRRLVRRVSS